MRPRNGWRSWETRKLGYLDGRDEEDLKVGQDKCDEKRVVIKSFYSWQIVDDVRAQSGGGRARNKIAWMSSLPARRRWRAIFRADEMVGVGFLEVIRSIAMGVW
jgi:hypothetical protein